MCKYKRVIAISGSIREGSSNTNVLKTLAAFIPEGIDYTIYNGIGELPHFNPDVDRVGAPIVVEKFRKTLSEAHALIICTPEYAKSIPGVLKNALEWLVSSARTKFSNDAKVTDEDTKEALISLVQSVVDEIKK
ncbi:NADPH-dependent FMN reductase [Bacillus toyonensis]|uniref:NADPH-dependent FMN reductase n=1 Tax=Bacillus toyonensis TaxID=155322 RepID=UPI000BEF816E|nr:NADPH-dependent FMN reductase [Bacillus toyonensis]PEK48233.1 flavoprotein [Bacillus toyonensis]